MDRLFNYENNDEKRAYSMRSHTCNICYKFFASGKALSI